MINNAWQVLEKRLQLHVNVTGTWSTMLTHGGICIRQILS